MANRYSKALKHIKKDYSLTEAPTNSMSRVYSLNNPGHQLGPVPNNAKVFVPDIDGNWPAGIPGTPGEGGYTRPAGFWTGERDWDTVTQPNFSHEAAGANGTDTTGLIASNGAVLTALPPNSRSFILGPLVDGHTYLHGNDAYTNIGYIQKDTRQFVLLARVDGQWEAGGYPIPETAIQYGWPESRVWDGTANGFTAYNSNFTLEMAQWFRGEMLGKRFVKEVAYFYSGGVSQPPITGGPASGMYGGSGVGAGGDGSSADGSGSGRGYGSGGEPNIGEPQVGNHGDSASANLWGMIWANIKGTIGNLPNIPGMMSWDDALQDVADRAQELWNTAQDVITDISDADNAFDYNIKLSTNLALSILTGKTIDIPLSDSATKDMINNIDPVALEQYLVIDQSTPKSAEENINPTGNKTDQVVKGEWGRQGGVNFNFNTDTMQLEIVSNKTLRTTSGGESVRVSSDSKTGLPERFTDIPEPTKAQIYDASTKIISNLSTSLGGPGLDPNLDMDLQLGIMRDTYDENQIVSGLIQAATDLMTVTTQGGVSNLIAIREGLKGLDFNGWKPFEGDSDVEAIGGAYGHVTSSTNVDLFDLPLPVQWHILNKLEFKPDGQEGLQANNNSGMGKPYTDSETFKQKGWDGMNMGEAHKKYFAKNNKLITESRKIQILKEIKKPVVLIEASPKMSKLKGYRPNFKGKFSPQNTPEVTACPESDKLAGRANARGQTWRTENKYWQGYETTERMNIIYDRMGHGQQAWDAIIEDARNKNGWKNREIQEQLNQIAHEKAMRKIDPDFESPWNLNEMEDPNKDEIDKYMNDPLVKRVRKKLLTQIDYKDKPSKKGYPEQPPVEIDPKTGMHPKYGKTYKYDKLDPVSAVSMKNAPTGNPEIDANVEKAAKKKYVKPNVKEEWASDWRDSISYD